MLTPAFHFRILEDFLPVMNEQAEVFVECLAAKESEHFDVVPMITKCTLDIICGEFKFINLSRPTESELKYSYLE